LTPESRQALAAEKKPGGYMRSRPSSPFLGPGFHDFTILAMYILLFVFVVLVLLVGKSGP
jgi:hypothetical protein